MGIQLPAYLKILESQPIKSHYICDIIYAHTSYDF